MDPNPAEWRQASTLLHGPFSAGALTTTEAVPPLMASLLGVQACHTVPSPSSSPRLLHAFKTSTIWETLTQVHLLIQGTILAPHLHPHILSLPQKVEPEAPAWKPEFIPATPNIKGPTVTPATTSAPASQQEGGNCSRKKPRYIFLWLLTCSEAKPLQTLPWASVSRWLKRVTGFALEIMGQAP